MKTTKDSIYTVLKNDNGSLYIIFANEIRRNEPLHNTFDRNGHRLSAHDSGDYSLYNRDSQAPTDMLNTGAKIFGESFRNLKYDFKFAPDDFSELDNDFTPVNLDELGLANRKEEIKRFLSSWEQKNANYNLVDAFTFWNGANNQSLIIKSKDYTEWKELAEDNEEYILAMRLWSEADRKDEEEWNIAGKERSIELEGRTIRESIYESDFEIARII